MTRSKTYAARFARWEVMVENLDPFAEGLEHVTLDHALLARKLVEARALQARVEDLRSQFRAATARMRKLAIAGDVTRGRIGAYLRGRYGHTSEALLRFGLKPKPVPRRRPKKELAANRAEGGRV